MPELSVTEEQLERLEALRTELEAAFVDGYAHVRRRDAVDYLLDTYTPPAERAGGAGPDDAADVERRVRAALDREVRDEEGEIDYAALQSVARETDGVKGSGMPAAEMYEAVLEATVEATGPGDAVELAVDPGESPAPADEDGGTDEDEGVVADESAATDGDADAGADLARDDDGAGAAAESTGPAGDDGSGTAGTDAGTGSTGGGSQLQQMMSLLRTHDDKWRKAESGDAPYEVDLPDGGTESVRTKDDVKRVLFTNY